NAVTSNSWTNWYSTISFTTDRRYQIEAQATDVAGNNSSITLADFTLDQNVPVSSAAFPVNGSFVQSISTGTNPIWGTFAETGSVNKGSVSTVTIAIQELGSPSFGNWWNGINA